MKPRFKFKPTSRKGVVPVRPLVVQLGVMADSFTALEDPDTKDWYVEGFASTDDVDLTQFAPTSKQPSGLRVMESALEDLVAWSKKLPTVFRNHDLNEEVGCIVDAAVKEGKFWVKIKISKTRPDIWTKILEGVLCKFSVSFIPLEESLVNEPGVAKPVRQIKRLVGLETSVVGLPMNPEADVTDAYAAGLLSNLEEFLAAQAEPEGEESMGRKQLIEGIKQRLTALATEKDSARREELQLEVTDYHQRLMLVASDVPAIADGWDFPAEAAPVVAAAPDAEEVPPAAEAVTPPAVEAAPVVAPLEPVVEATAAGEAALAAVAPEAAPAEATAERLISDAVSQMFSTVVKRAMPMSVFGNMACLEEAISMSGMPTKAKTKAMSMLVDMLKMVAESVQVERAASQPVTDLGAIQRMFDAKFAEIEAKQAERDKTAAEQLAALQADLAAKAEALGLLEKKHAEVMGMTLTPSNAAPPPAQPARKLTKDEELMAAWADKPLISIGR